MAGAGSEEEAAAKSAAPVGAGAASSIHAAGPSILLRVAELASRTRREICDTCLEESLAITGSRIGYLAFLNEDESVLTMYSWSLASMAECAIDEKPRVYPVSSTGLWGEAVRQRRPIVTNDYGAPSPLKKGVPPGHVRVTRHLNVPIFDRGRIVLVAGVGNKEGEYSPADVANLTVLMQGLWQLLERKRAEDTLRSIIDNMQDAHFRADLSGRFTLVSPSAVRMYGYDSSAQMLGMDARELYADEAERHSVLDQLRRTGRVHDRVGRGRRRDGSTFWVSMNVQAVRDESGQVVGTEGVVRDVTDRMEAEQAVLASEAKYRQLFESLIDAFVTVDMSGRLVEFNRAYQEMLGYSAEELRRLSYVDLTPTRWHELEARLVREQVMVRGYSDVYEKEYVRKDGTLFPVELRTVLRRAPDGTPVAMWAIIRDITERKRAEKALRASEERRVAERLRAEEAHRQLRDELVQSQKMEAVGRLAGGVAHDFNNLLTVILSYAGLAAKALRDGDPVRANVLEVKKAGERAAALTSQLLAFSRRQVMQPQVLDLNRVVTDLRAMLLRILGEDVAFEQELATDLGPTLADPIQLGQVFMNLVVNARDAMPEGGRLTVTTRNVLLDGAHAGRHAVDADGPFVELKVTDTGCGMDEETRARVFEPFFTTKEKGKGTGLGLSTVFGIVKQSGGGVTVESEVGKGTTFRIFLPRVEPGPATVAARDAGTPGRSSGSETILVVEDEEALRRVAARILGDAGYAVSTAASGEEAVSECERFAGEIDLLLTDVVMPGMSGRTLAGVLQKARPRLKVIYMSGYTDNAICHRGVLDEGLRFIAKPFEPEELVRRVRERLDEPG